jgi:hypothetical protein
MTNLMHKFFNLFYLSIYFCLTCFRLSLSPSSEAGVQLQDFWVWFQCPGAETIPRRPEPLPLSCTPASEDGLKENPKHVRQK